MSMVREFFLAEAESYLDQLIGALDASGPAAGDAHTILRVARGLRGSARMARADAVVSAADLLEQAGRALSTGRLGWEPDTSRRLRDTAHDVRRLLRLTEGTDAQERVVAGLRERWHEIGIPTGAEAAADSREVAEDPEAFRRFVGAELGGIVAALDAALDDFQADPDDRTPLDEILRAQRGLRGSARLDEIPLVGETLRALDDLTGMVARLEVPVVNEWADIFRSARAVLAAAAPGLRHGDEPITFRPGLAKLRTLRSELTDRFPPPKRRAPAAPDLEPADVQDAAPPHAPEPAPEAGPASEPAWGGTETPGAPAPEPSRAAQAEQAPPAQADAADTDAADADAADADAADAADEDVVPIETLLYRGERAVSRAGEIRTALERAVGGDPQGRAALVELYDLVRLAAE